MSLYSNCANEKPTRTVKGRAGDVTSTQQVRAFAEFDSLYRVSMRCVSHECSFRCGESCWWQALIRFRDWFESTIHRQISFPCTSCGSASEVAVKPFLLGGALQVSFALRVLSPPFTARHNQANEIARVLQLSPIGD